MPAGARGPFGDRTMPTLSSSIVKRNVASMRDVEEALARQVLYGGDLATNLLELAAVSESALTTLLAESHELLPAPLGELPRASDTTLQIVPGDLALRHGFYPLGERDGELVIAVSEPLSAEIEQDLTFSLGAQLAQRAAPLVRIRQAVARDYDLPMDRRTLRLIAKLEGRPDPSPSSIPAASRMAQSMPPLPRPASVPPMAYPSTLITPRGAGDGAPVERSSPPVEMPRPSNSDGLRTLISPRRRPPGAAVPPVDTRGATELPPAAPAPDLAAAKRGPPRARGRKRHRGPYTAAMAEADLMEAESRDDVLGAFFDFSSQFFEYSALFAVHSDIAEGRDADGQGADRARVRTIGVPLDLPSVLSKARDSGTWQVSRLEREGLDAGLTKDLQRRAGAMVAIVPIVVRGRCVLLLYGDHGEADVSLNDIGDVLAFAPLVATGLERVIMLRKRRARGEVDGTSMMPTPAMPPARHRHALPSPEQRRDALARMLDDAAVSSAPSTDEASPQARRQSDSPPTTNHASPHALRSDAPKPRPPADTPETVPETVAATPAAALGFPPADPAPVTVAATPGARKSDEPPSTAVEAPKAKSRNRSIPSRAMLRVGASHNTPPHGTPAAEPEARPFQLTRRPASSPPASAELPSESEWDAPVRPSTDDDETPRVPPDVARAFGRGEALPPPPPRSNSAPRLELVEEYEVDQEELAREYKRADSDSAVTMQIDSREVPLAPSSRKVAYGPVRPRPRHSSPGIRLPSVIIDLEADCQHLVDRLEGGDEAAADRLVDMGEAAVLVLVARFPGPIHGEMAHRFADSASRASDCGPILRTLLRIGEPASQFLIVRTADGDPKTRRWATWLLGEIPTCDGARAIVRRAADQDAEVRKAAVAAGRLLQSDLDARTALRDGLATLAADPEQSQETREAAIEALAEIRDGRAVPRLIPLLTDDSVSLAKSAAWALATLARQQFGRDPKAWSVWWAKHSAEHRVEWLIASLMHEDADVRRAAGEELKSITKEYFGYYEDLPKKERARVQRKYTDWWGEKGKARFY